MNILKKIPLNLRIVLGILIINIVWASCGFLKRIELKCFEDLPIIPIVILIAGLNQIIGGIILIITQIKLGNLQDKPLHRPAVLIGGILNALYAVSIYLLVSNMPMKADGLLCVISGFVLVLFSVIFFKEKISGLKLVAYLFILGYLPVIFTGGTKTGITLKILIGMILVSIIYALCTLYCNAQSERNNNFYPAAIAIIGGLICILLSTVALREHIPETIRSFNKYFFIAFGVYACIYAFTHIIYYWVVKYVDAGTLNTFTGVEAVSSLIMAAVLNKETVALSSWVLTGSLFISSILGIVLVLRGRTWVNPLLKKGEY